MSPTLSRQSYGSRCIALAGQRWWAAHELAAMGLFLPCDDASYVNWQAIPVDGDLTASMPHAGKRFRYLLVMAGQKARSASSRFCPAIHPLRKTPVKIDGYAVIKPAYDDFHVVMHRLLLRPRLLREFPAR
jgi:hypothetical protein